MKTIKLLLMILGAAFVAAPTCVLAIGAPKLIQISALPFTISAPGTYVLTRDLSWFDPSGQLAAITIQSPAANGFAGPVILDLQGHTMESRLLIVTKEITLSMIALQMSASHWVLWNKWVLEC